MGVGAGLYMYDVVKTFTFAISSTDEFLPLMAADHGTCDHYRSTLQNKNSPGDEIANVNFYAVRRNCYQSSLK